MVGATHRLTSPIVPCRPRGLPRGRRYRVYTAGVVRALGLRRSYGGGCCPLKCRAGGVPRARSRGLLWVMVCLVLLRLQGPVRTLGRARRADMCALAAASGELPCRGSWKIWKPAPRCE